jgi:hypothetical protein
LGKSGVFFFSTSVLSEVSFFRGLWRGGELLNDPFLGERDEAAADADEDADEDDGVAFLGDGPGDVCGFPQSIAPPLRLLLYVLLVRFLNSLFLRTFLLFFLRFIIL